MSDSIKIRSGDIMYVNDRYNASSDKTMVVEEVWRKKLDGPLHIKFRGADKVREIYPDEAHSMLVSRAEDLRSPKALNLRYMESMLFSQIRIVSDASSGTAFSEIQELHRTLSSVRQHIRDRGGRPCDIPNDDLEI